MGVAALNPMPYPRTGGPLRTSDPPGLPRKNSETYVLKIEDTALPGVKILTPRRFADARGWFSEV
jgi:hypothetical protein